MENHSFNWLNSSQLHMQPMTGGHKKNGLDTTNNCRMETKAF